MFFREGSVTQLYLGKYNRKPKRVTVWIGHEIPWEVPTRKMLFYYTRQISKDKPGINTDITVTKNKKKKNNSKRPKSCGIDSHGQWTMSSSKMEFTTQYNTIRCQPRKQCRKTHGKGVCEYIQNNRAWNRKPNAKQPYSSLEFYPAGQFYDVMIIWKGSLFKSWCKHISNNFGTIA